MRNIALLIRYDGTAYHGWQTQKNALAVQSVLSTAIEKLTGARPIPELSGCGRTDAGVHALNYVANFKSDCTVPAKKFHLAIAPHLPEDVAVIEAKDAPEDFHARFSCEKKEYVYRIYTASVPDPFYRNRACFSPFKIDADLVNRAAAYYVGEKDFKVFCASGATTKTSVRNVYFCRAETEGNLTSIYIQADGFLYNMVRIMAGTLIYVSQRKILPDEMPEIIENGVRADAGITAPACGLYLNRVWYNGSCGLDGI